MPIIANILTQQFHLSSRHCFKILRYIQYYNGERVFLHNSSKLVLNKVSRLWKGQPAGKENNETAVHAASLTGTRNNKAE